MSLKILLYLSITSVVFVSCRSYRHRTLTQVQESNELCLKIEALNISEDLSRLASNNDEILILAYQDQNILSTPLIIAYNIFDKKHKKHLVPLVPNLIENADLVFFILELDTERELEEIELTVRQSATELIRAYSTKDRIMLKDILGDDDLLGVKKIKHGELGDKYYFSISGFHKMDLYEYEFNFLNLN